MAADHSYNYQPLPEGSIRLVELLAGEKDDELRCSVETVRLKDRPEYEAVSYVWGPRDPPVYLPCGDGCVRITANLASGLRQVRFMSQNRLSWADQISINQEDNAERSAQVSIMGDIFGTAEWVIMWLGPDSETRPQARLADKLIEKLAWLQGQSYFEYDSVTDAGLAEHGLPPLSSPAWEALGSFVSLPYFSRVWIIQEIALGRRHEMFWGTTPMDLDAVEKAINFMMDNVQLSRSVHSSFIANVHQVFSQNEKAMSLLEVVEQGHTKQDTDPRDKIFAHLSMLPEIGQ